MTMHSIRHAVTLALLVCAGAAPAQAEWLVLRDQSRVEIRGDWQRRGAVLVFTTRSGTLASLRVEEVDLEATAAANDSVAANDQAEQAAVASAPKRSVLILRDGDLPRYRPSAPAAPTQASSPSAAATTAPGEVNAAGLEVESWQRAEDHRLDGVEIRGLLRNRGRQPAVEVSVEVRFLDGEGALLATAPAIVPPPAAVPAGGVIPFRAVVADLDRFDRAAFSISAGRLEIQVADELDSQR